MTDTSARRARPTARPSTVIALTMLAVAVAQSFGRFTYALLLPAMQADLLGSYALAGLLGTANVGAYLAGSLLVAAVSHRVEPARLVKVGLIGSSTGLAVLAVAPAVWAVLVGMVLTGVAGAAIWIPAPGLAGAAVPPHRRGVAMGLVSSGVGIGIAAASQLTAVVRGAAGDDAWRQVWAVEAAVGVVALVAALRWLRPPASPGAVVREAGLGALRRVPGWLPVTAAYAAYGFAYSLFINYVVAALEEDAGFSAAHASAVYALVGVSVIFGGVLLGRLSDRAGRRPTLVGGYLVMAGAALLVLTGVEPWAAVAAVGFGLVMSGLPAVIAAHLGDHLDPRSFGAAFGSVTLAFGVAQLFGPQVGGWIGDATGGFTLAFLLSAAVAAVGAAASWKLPRPGR